MALNQVAYRVKNPFWGLGVITSSTTVNTNTDSSGTLHVVQTIGTSTTALTFNEKFQLREIRAVLTGNLATATAIRFFVSTVTSGFTSSNTTYISNDLTLPVTTFSTTTANSPQILAFDPGEMPLPASFYLLYAVTSTITNGARIIVRGDSFTE